MRPTYARATAFAALAALGFSFGLGTTPAHAARNGYLRPRVVWGGYAPRAYAPPPAPAARSVTPRWGYAPASRPAPPASGVRQGTPPAHHREYGTGRNVFMHKPWLPGQ